MLRPTPPPPTPPNTFWPVPNKPKTSLKNWIRIVSKFIHLIQFLLICQMLANLSGVESESTISKFRKRKRKSLCCVHLSYYLTGTREIGKFHVAIVQRRLRYVQKRVMHVQSCCFANVSLLLFCRSRCRLCCFISILLSSRNFAVMVTDVTKQNKTKQNKTKQWNGGHVGVQKKSCR